MALGDILNKALLSGFTPNSISTREMAAALLITAMISIYIFFCYRLLVRRTFYSKSFNISLIAVAVITAAIVLTIQTNLVVSLGMVGALSIVRFRTAVKDPMDLIFLFWSISIGIICGAGWGKIALLLSALLSFLIFLFDKLPMGKAAQILIINAKCDAEMDAYLADVLKAHCRPYCEKSRSIINGKMDLVYELRTKRGIELTTLLSAHENIYSVSLLNHDGEVTF